VYPFDQPLGSEAVDMVACAVKIGDDNMENVEGLNLKD